MPSPGPNNEEGRARRGVFLSYAREDTAVALRVADALRSQDIDVWYDQSELRGGDAWDQKIRRQIKECALFVPIISERTQARGEGYFRLEWKLAVERSHLMAEGVSFLAPVAVDETREDAALVPPEFLRVQWMRLPGSLPTHQFVEEVKRMLAAPTRVSASPFRAPAARSTPAREFNRRWWVAGGVAVLVAAVAVAFILSRRPSDPIRERGTAPAASSAPAAPAVSGKSIAVLPFDNMSDEKDNAFFTDGVHEDVLTNLSYVRDLRVVSRTSVMQYRSTTKSIKEIGRELGVAYILEGSVRRAGNKVRVTGQLIDARTDEHVWAKAYDRDLNDIFAIQGELAQAIADALQSVLSPETKILLARRPTENTWAFDDYLKARALRNSGRLGNENAAIHLLESAVRLDPNFGAAWAELGSRRAFLYFGDVQTDEQLRLAKEAIDSAQRIAPDDPSVIEGVGDYYYYGYRDYARATESYMRLEQMRPNDPLVYYSLGLIQRRQGRFADSLPNLRHALQLDPTNEEYGNTLGEVLVGVRLFDEALGLARKYSAANPANLQAAWYVAVIAFQANGSTSDMKTFAQRTVPESNRSDFIYFQSGNAAAIGDWAEYIRLNREQRYFDNNPEDPRWNQDVETAEIFAETGDMSAARSRAQEAVLAMNNLLAGQPNNALLWSDLALARALLGEKDGELQSAQKASSLVPESRDAVMGPAISINCAMAASWAGDKEKALAELKRLLQVPYGLNLYTCRNGWRPLRDDPRFKALMADPKNNAPLI